MDYRILGRTGVKVSPFCLGSANFADPTPEHESIRIIDRALEAGINVIDSGNTYADGESERIVGKALKRNGQRHQVILSTKMHYPIGHGPNDSGNSRLHILRACDTALRHLQTDYIDLFQMHRPSPEIPIDETLGALTDLVRQGKVLYIGCSTHPAWQVMEAIMVSELKGYARYISEQPPYNLLDRRIENELIPLCQRYGLAIMPWSPMAMGILAGRYADAAAYPTDSRAALRGGIYAERITAKGIEVGNTFVKLAAETGLSPAQLANLWVKDQPGITAPIIGPRTLQQLEEMLPVMEMVLTDDVRAACDQMVPPGSTVANFFNSAAWMRMQII